MRRFGNSLTRMYNYRRHYRSMQHCKERTYLVLLNSESLDMRIVRACWHSSKTILCADGSANKLHDNMKMSGCSEVLIPDYIIGDLDSVREDVIDTYKARGVQVIKDPDQDSNDLDKCLAHIQSMTTQTGSNGTAAESTIIIIGAYGGRFDQEAAALHALYRWTPSFGHIVLLGEHASTFLLMPGVVHSIPFSPNLHDGTHLTGSCCLVEGPTCGLIPLANRVHSVTTTGLTWNLSEEPLEMGVRISTSNRVAEGATEVTVLTSEPILWTWANRILSDAVR